jgi:hypothetical protein
MVIVIINYVLTIKICYYNMFTLEQQIFIVQCFFSNGERLGPIRHLEFLRNFNKNFRTFKAPCPESLQMRKQVFGNR